MFYLFKYKSWVIHFWFNSSSNKLVPVQQNHIFIGRVVSSQFYKYMSCTKTSLARKFLKNAVITVRHPDNASINILVKDFELYCGVSC